MKKSIVKISIAIILIIISIVYIAIPYNSVKLKSASKNDIDSYILSKMDELRIPGVSLGIVNGNDIYLKGYGKTGSSEKEITAQTPFLLGSTTKSITALAVMQLSEKGEIDLDEKVIAYMPGFSFSNKNESDKITVRQLLNQTSGIAGPTGGSDYLDADSIRPDFISKLKNESLSYTPGSTYQYAEANFVILGELISIVSGQSYESYVKEHIFTPLKMNNSFTDKKDALASGLADGNITWFGYPVKTDLPYPKQYTSASAVYSSAEDLAHYILCCLNKGTYENQTLVSEQGMNQILNPAVALEHPTGYSYGMGWYINDSFAVHDGRPTNYYSIILLKPESKTGITLLANANNRLVTAEYLMPIVYEIMNTLNGEDTVSSGFGFRLLYKITNVIFLWILIFLVYRIMSTVTNLPKKLKFAKTNVLFYIKNSIADVSFILFLACLLIYLLNVYGVSLKIAYLGQPDIIFCFGIYIALIFINIILKIIKIKHNSGGTKCLIR